MKRVIAIVVVAAAIPLLAAAQGSIRNPENTFGKSRAAIQRLCNRDGDEWFNGMCMLSGNGAVMFEWRNGKVFEHTIMKEGVDFGRGMVRELRKIAKEDSTALDNGCKEWIWRNVGGRRVWVIICPSKGFSTASSRKLR